MNGRIPLIIDGGSCEIGVESTVISFAEDPPRLLRPGGVTLEEMTAVIGEIVVDDAVLNKLEEGAVASSPGMKYKHYASKADMLIVEGAEDAVIAEINRRTYQAKEAGRKVAVVATEETKDRYEADVVLCMGKRDDEDSIARHMYKILRECDELEVQEIYSESFQTPRIGQAIMNRLLKAAGHQVIHV